MNYKPFVAWGFYGGANPQETANYTGSWGLIGSLNEEIPVIVAWVGGVFNRFKKWLLFNLFGD